MRKFKTTGRNLPKDLSEAATVMTVVALDRLMETKDINKLDIVIRFRHHSSPGEVFCLSKNKYEIIIDHHQVVEDAWGRKYPPEERVAKVVSLVGHEITHLWQYYTGQLKYKNKKLLHLNKHYVVSGTEEDQLQQYFDLPFEEEARGKEEGHMLAFLIKWKLLKEQGIV